MKPFFFIPIHSLFTNIQDQPLDTQTKIYRYTTHSAHS